MPLLSQTLPGNGPDDPLYVPAWQTFAQVLGHRDFLFVADAKAASLQTRATIAHAGGAYLFPLPMTGEVPDLLRQWVRQPPTAIRPLHLPTAATDPTPREVGQGFRTWRRMTATLANGTAVTWNERWLITRSPAQAEQQQARLHQRLAKAEAALGKLKPKAGERAADVLSRATTLLEQHQVMGLLHVTVSETAVTSRRSGRRGRPAAETPVKTATHWQVTVQVARREAAIAVEEQVAGWRVYVTNTRQERLSHAEAIGHYRGQWVAEHGYHRFKAGAIPALPLLLRIPTRIVGLLVVLLLGLQVLTVLELVARRSLAERNEEVAGLVPGNPKLRTATPTAERLLAAFGNLHLLVITAGGQAQARLVEALSPLQRYILELLHLSPSCYDLATTFTPPPAEAAQGAFCRSCRRNLGCLTTR